VGVERLDKVRSYLRLYLNWVQNSVFEGELTRAQLYEVKKGIRTLIDEQSDSVFVYTARDPRLVERASIGTAKAEVDNII